MNERMIDSIMKFTTVSKSEMFTIIKNRTAGVALAAAVDAGDLFLMISGSFKPVWLPINSLPHQDAIKDVTDLNLTNGGTAVTLGDYEVSVEIILANLKCKEVE